MIKSIITDPRNKQQVLTQNNSLLIQDIGYPALGSSKIKIFQSYLETSAGSNDMGVDGSSTNQKFYISADENADTYITLISFLVGYGTTALPFEFADSAAALTNGFRLYYHTEKEEVDIGEAIKSNADLMRYGIGGILPTAWELRGIGALNDYGYLVNIDMSRIMPNGIKLDRGTKQELAFLVRDDASDADTFNAQCFGFQRFE